MTTYLEFGSQKFWEVTVSGAQTTVRFGKVGANGQTQEKTHASAAAAAAFAQKKADEKIKKGYAAPGGKRAAPAAAPAAPAKKAKAAAPAPAPAKGKKRGAGPGPLDGEVVALSGKLSESRAKITARLEALGAKVKGSVTGDLTVLIASEDEVEEGSAKVDKAGENGIPIVKEGWLEACEAAGDNVAKDGFVHGDGDEDDGDDGDDGDDDDDDDDGYRFDDWVIPEVLKANAHLRRDCWTAVTREKEHVVGPVSKMGGVPFMMNGAAWPQCSDCNKPLSFYLQLRIEHLPEEQRERLGGSGLAQLFMCCMCCEDGEIGECDFFDGDAPGCQPRLVSGFSDADTSSVTEAPEGAHTFPEKLIAAWKVHDDFPGYDDIPDEANLDDAAADIVNGALHFTQEKLGGWATWIQGAERLACEKCGAEMREIFTLEHDDDMWTFGDCGTAIWMGCLIHPDQMSLTWACS